MATATTETVLYMKSYSTRTPSTTLTFHQGATWCIDDIDTSYEILEQGRIGAWICQRVVRRPDSWTGSEFIGSVTVPGEVVKEDTKGRWIRLGVWDRIHWRQAAQSTDAVGIAEWIDELRLWMKDSLKSLSA
jgi:hypothetical protein